MEINVNVKSAKRAPNLYVISIKVPKKREHSRCGERSRLYV